MTITRRDLLTSLACGGLLGRATFGGRGSDCSHSEKLETVTGAVTISELGFVLPHEHVLVDFIGADRVSPDRYDADEVARVALPHLRRARELGVRTIFECTPAYLGRDPLLLRRLSQESGLRLVTNTGYYAANGGKHLPEQAHRESVDEIAGRWIAEARNGIDGTTIRPGFIKIGVDAGPLEPVGRNLIRAASRTHLATGLTIAAHTGDGRAAFAQLAILEEEGVARSAWIWVHAQNESDTDKLLDAAKHGAWIELDGIGSQSIDEGVRLVRLLKDARLLDRVLLSHDAGWYHVGEAGGGEFRPYTPLIKSFLPAASAAGLSDRELTMITHENPRAAYAPRVRLRDA